MDASLRVMSDRLILITNDDGIDSPGIKKLAGIAVSYGDVYVVAPDSERSGMSHSFTYKTDISAWEYDIGVQGVKAFASDGTPCDCVRIGALGLLPRKPDVVLAGINAGYNISSDIQYSATVGSVLEAAFQGIHAIAFSKGVGQIDNDTVVDEYIDGILSGLIDSKLDYNQAWNVNFPLCTKEECKGIMRDCRISMDAFYKDVYDKRFEDGRFYLKIRQGRDWEASEGTDLYAVINNYISIGTVTNIK